MLAITVLAVTAPAMATPACPSSWVPTAHVDAAPTLDARELKRFGIPKSGVPGGTVLRFRQVTPWEEYGVWILAGATLLFLQTALMAGLLAQRRRRRAAQEQLADRLRLQALVAEISTAFSNATPDKVEQQMVRSLERVGRELGADDCAIWTWRGPHDAPHLVCRWLTRAGAIPVTSVLDDALLTWGRARLELGHEVHVGDVTDVVEAGPEADAHPHPSMLLLPLRVDARVIGVFSLRHAHARPWTPQVIGDLRTIGEILGSAVVRTQMDTSIRTQLETLAHVNRLAGLGELAASIAHELNQPLAAILANTEVAINLLSLPDPPLDEVREIVADVIADDERAGGILRNVRSMLRSHRVDAAAVDVNAVAREVTRLVAHDPRLRACPVDLELGDDLPPVTVDATQLKQVLLNLVVNAVDAMASSPVRLPVRLHTAGADGGALVVVRDHGPGIPEDVLGRLFDPFFTTKVDGLGVGLAISRSIVEAAGGRITAENAGGGGAAFRVWMPASPGPAGHPARQASPPPASPA